MGVRCTLLGHKYGDAEIEREREERGEEAVVTIREVKTCSRCGDRSVVSENKEVTAAGAGPEVATPDDADAAPTSEPRPTDPDAGDPVAEESVEGAAEAAGADAGVDAEPEGAAGDAPAEEGPEHDPETDDGVILDDEPSEEEPAEREYGEWPDAEGDHASAEADPASADAEGDPAPWPDADEDADEGYDAAPPDDGPADVDYPEGTGADGVDVDGTDAAPVGDEQHTGTEQSAGSEEPSDAGESADPDEPVSDDAELLDDEGQSADAPPADEGADFERARAASSPNAPSTGGTELFCPACGYRDPSHDGSLREGDICPECRKGYLAAGE